MILHSESVKAAIDHGHGAGHKRGGIRDEILDGATQLFRSAETFERGLTDYICSTLRQ